MKSETWVLDCSAVAALLFHDEDGEQIESIFSQTSSGATIHAPSLLPFEFFNALRSAEKRKRIQPDQAREISRCFWSLPIDIDSPPNQLTMHNIHHLALQHNLTIYDAAYLELTLRLQAKLKTFDRDLAAAQIG